MLFFCCRGFIALPFSLTYSRGTLLDSSQTGGGFYFAVFGVTLMLDYIHSVVQNVCARELAPLFTVSSRTLPGPQQTCCSPSDPGSFYFGFIRPEMCCQDSSDSFLCSLAKFGRSVTALFLEAKAQFPQVFPVPCQQHSPICFSVQY